MTATIESAMVMAAGIGKRMRPLTATRPKPLVRVAGKPLIDHSLDRIEAAGIGHVVVNVHYLADALEAHLAKQKRSFTLAVSDERGELLETGGGMVKALPLLKGDPILIVNSDNIWTDGPQDSIRNLARHWDGDRMDALLLVIRQASATGHGGKGDFHMDPSGKLSRRKPGRVAPFVYTGIQLISPRLLVGAPDGPFSTNLLWDRAIAAGRLYGLSHMGQWFDVGTPASIAPTEAALSEV
ncbi:nucleotidyltransferase family protein [Sphingopyxis terrae]|uniref:MurNAc alpha-1-phosphate uridylyltransferase n=1 Tax=Sphingopyxis terrae subsp. ummariensis TaxID=429001 RepID=A0A1Y6FPF2_9SPHN|nr:nucleotidyltransferase family protein [Sphingopyxis terrae]PCF91599.1 nucleotidyltransferase family protein [Sphingopyxis terrae subsp. ummariensis]SMQ76818.1 MurNAc alpha-1-phosphate uridylyltransferase [Sphingopyxis terrae subsp. ummariensis]